MITYQDFLKVKEVDKLKPFIIGAIQGFKENDFYKRAVEANLYYRGENPPILNRLMWFYNSMGVKTPDALKANNKIASEFFNKIVSQENSYLLGNGATLDEKIKKELGGNKFDVKLQMCGLTSLIEGVSWGYCHINKFGKFDIKEFKGVEFIPLFDERTSELMAGIRFIELGVKGTIIELYELDGKTEYILKENKLTITEPKTSYRITKAVDKLETKVIAVKNWSVLPIFPLYGNEIKRSTLSTGLKSKIDVYDFVASDLANNLEENKDIIYLLKNYSGEGIGTFLADLKYHGVVNVDEDGDINTKQIEVPHEARKIAMETLKANIYSDAMALDTETIRGGSLTNVAIKTAMIDLDLKTDKFEWQVIDYLENVLNLYAEFKGATLGETEIKFIRRNIVNDTEIIENIYKCREDISRRTALELNPYIEDIEEELLKIEEEAQATVTINPEPVKGKLGAGEGEE